MTMARSIRFAGTSLLILLIALIVTSATPDAYAQTDPGSEPVRVYTNADLALLGPLPSEPAGPPPVTRSDEEENWEFVTDFIESQRARIDADRSHELERERVASEAEDDGGHGRPYLGYYGYHPGRYPYGSSRGNRNDRSLDRSKQLNVHAPHKMFRDKPPVREHVPGLGDSYRRGKTAGPARGHRTCSH